MGGVLLDVHARVDHMELFRRDLVARPVDAGHHRRGCDDQRAGIERWRRGPSPRLNREREEAASQALQEAGEPRAAGQLALAFQPGRFGGREHIGGSAQPDAVDNVGSEAAQGGLKMCFAGGRRAGTAGRVRVHARRNRGSEQAGEQMHLVTSAQQPGGKLAEPGFGHPTA